MLTIMKYFTVIGILLFFQKFQQISTSSSGPKGNIIVECRNQEVLPGNYKFVCEGVNKDSITLKNEHVLWLSTNQCDVQVLDIEIPNYRIEQFIKAGFKRVPGSDSQINLLLKKPQQFYDAQVDSANLQGRTPPRVQLKYEPTEKTLIHFPNDRPYSPFQGPLLPPSPSRTRYVRNQRPVFNEFPEGYDNHVVVNKLRFTSLTGHR